MNDRARNLSGGMKRRLMIAKAMIHRPKLLILDEPTAGVDVSLRQKIWQLVRRLNAEGTTILFTTHYLEEAEFCNNIILINAGKLIAQGNPKELKTNYLHNTILEIECSKIVDAMEILEKQKFVEETSIFGNNIHININEKLI